LTFQEKMAGFVPSWNLTKGSIINTPFGAREFFVNAIPDADRFQYRTMKNGIIGGQFCQTLYENLATSLDMLQLFCWLSEAYEKVCSSHEVLATKIENFMKDRIETLKENVELCDS
jgi:hypothetical protein